MKTLHCKEAYRIEYELTQTRDLSQEITIPLAPVALKRHRHKQLSSDTIITFDPQKKIKQQLASFIKTTTMYHEGPLHMCITLFMPIPDSLSPNKKLAHENQWHYKKPDSSNMLKFYEDLLNEIIYKDDSQLAAHCLKKIYSSEPRIVITISRLL